MAANENGGGDLADAAIPKEFSHPLHAKCMLVQLNESRKNPRLCDGIVVIEGCEIPVQRNILAAASPFFRALYSYDSESGPTIAVSSVRVDNISADTFSQIIDYIYTSVVSLTEENIQDVTQAADLLLIGHLKELCCDFLEQCVSTANCLGIAEFTERFTCPGVNAVVTQFVNEHFRDVSYTEEFMELRHDRLQELLQRDSLVVRIEDLILDAILRWVEHDRGARLSHLETLLKDCVRLRFVDARYVRQCVDNPLIQCCHLGEALSAWRGADTESRRRGDRTMVIVCGGVRLPEASEDHAHGDGRDLVVMKSVHAAMFHDDPHSQSCRWIELAPMLQCRVRHAVVISGGLLFAVGGCGETTSALKSGEKYDPRTNSWSAIAPMSQERRSFGLVSIDDKLYALGGCEQTTSVEEYDIHTNKWRPLPSMNMRRRQCAYAVCRKKIYVAGGGFAGQVYDGVECYDPRTESWSSIAPMKERRRSACAAGYTHLMYAFGGYRPFMCPSAMHQGEPPVKFCGTEVYSSEHQRWETLANTGMCSMTPDCVVVAAQCVDDEIVLIGRLKADCGYEFMRAYRPMTDSWRGVLVNAPTSVGEGEDYQCALLKMPAYLTLQLLYEQNLLSRAEKEHYSRFTQIPDAVFFQQKRNVMKL